MKYRQLLSTFVLGLAIGLVFSPASFTQTVFAKHKRPTPTPTSIPNPTTGNDFRGGYYSNLSNSNFDSTFIAYHDFTGFDFSNASIRFSQVKGSNLSQANLTNVDFTGSNLNGANLTGANLTGIKWYNCPEGDGVCGSTTCPDGHSIGTHGATCL